MYGRRGGVSLRRFQGEWVVIPIKDDYGVALPLKELSHLRL